MPGSAGRVLVRALTSVARLTFPCSAVDPAATSVWSSLDGDRVRVVAGKSGFMALGSTRRPERATGLFDDGAFPWWLQGQVVLLSEPDAAPPDIDEAGLLGLIGDDWTKQGGLLSRAGVRGILRPGVDGDVAGLLSLTGAFERSALGALEREASNCRLAWALLSEASFTSALR
jgi:hypothetical protein